MSELIPFDFCKNHQGIGYFLATQNQIAYTKDHKFIYGTNKAMKHTELLEKLQALAVSLHASGNSLPADVHHKISLVLSSVSQLTEAKLNQIIPTKKSNAMLKERLNEVNRLAVDLDVDLQPANRVDLHVISEQKWIVPLEDGKTQTTKKQFALRRFVDGKTELTCEVLAKPITKSIPDARRTSSSGYRASIDEPKIAKEIFCPENLSTIRKNVAQKLSQRERKSLIDQLHQSLLGQRKEGVSANFTQQLATLATLLEINMQGFDGLDEIAIEIVANSINSSRASPALCTSIKALSQSVRCNLEELMRSSNINCEITRHDGTATIALNLKSFSKALLVDSSGAGIRPTQLRVDAHLNPITGASLEKVLIY